MICVPPNTFGYIKIMLWAWCLEFSLGALHPAENKEELSVTLYTQDSPNNLGYTPTEPKIRPLILGHRLAPTPSLVPAPIPAPTARTLTLPAPTTPGPVAGR